MSGAIQRSFDHILENGQTFQLNFFQQMHNMSTTSESALRSDKNNGMIIVSNVFDMVSVDFKYRLS